MKRDLLAHLQEENSERIITKHYNSLTGKDPIKRQKTYAYATRKGYESFVINEVLNELRKNSRNV